MTGERIAVVDTRQDQVTGIVDLRGTGVKGEVCAIAFDSWHNLFALSSQGANGGSLVFVPYDEGGWGDTSASVHGLADEAPRNVAIQRTPTGKEYVYVCFGGTSANYAAMGFDYDTSTGAITRQWNISDLVPGRQAFAVHPGCILPASPGITRQKDTATSRAFDVVMDNSLGEKGYLLYYWTANIGFLRKTPSAPFTEMSAATEVGGEFNAVTGIDTTSMPRYEPATGLQGSETLLEWAQQMFIDGYMYFNTEFPLAMALDQQAALLALAYAGDGGKLQMLFTDKMTAADEFLHGSPQLSPGSDSLDDVYESIRNVGQLGVSYDFPLDLAGARDVAFGPQLSILTPKPGATCRGAVAVNVILRDPDIISVKCRVLRLSNNAEQTKTIVLTADQRKYGYLWEPLFVFQPDSVTAPFLEHGAKYLLEVTGLKSGGRAVIARQEFWYD
jgi:hypothetical protein